MHLLAIFKLIICFVLFCSIHGEELEEGCVNFPATNETDDVLKVYRVLQEGLLYSPGFLQNKNYPDKVLCSYQLQAPEGMHVRIRFNLLDIDISDSCVADVLVVFNIDSHGEEEPLGMVCGNQTLNDFVSVSNTLKLVFKTDDFVGRKGFNITYLLQDNGNVCLTTQKQCRNRKCVERSVICDGNDDCGDGTDEERCPGDVLPFVECGRPDIDHTTFADFDRIVGGQEAVKGSWPWMADLQMRLIEPSSHVCGGSLVNAQWILTAAHCFESLPSPKDWRIHLGNHDKFQKEPEGQVRFVDRIVIYDDIPPDVFEKDGEYDDLNDMALIKLNAPVKFSKYIKPICLSNPQQQLSRDLKCYATGWGLTRGTGSSHALKQAIHPVQPDINCQRLVGDKFNSSTMICAGSMEPLNGLCHGDSGSPLVCETEKGKWNIEGILSYATDNTIENALCGLEGRPSVFIKVAVKTAWIRRIIDRYS